MLSCTFVSVRSQVHVGWVSYTPRVLGVFTVPCLAEFHIESGDSFRAWVSDDLDFHFKGTDKFLVLIVMVIMAEKVPAAPAEMSSIQIGVGI